MGLSSREYVNWNNELTLKPSKVYIGFFSSLEQIWRNVLLHHCSPTDPLQWMGAVRMRVQITDKNNGPLLFTSKDVNWWSGVMWITCGLVWCFYQLFGLWRQPFAAVHFHAEDPLVIKWWNATFLKIMNLWIHFKSNYTNHNCNNAILFK